MKIIDQLKKVNLIQFVPAIFVISLVGNSVFGYTAPKSEKSKNNSENQVEAATTQAKKKTKKANAGDIDLSKIKDGTYEGQANGYRGLVKVSVTVKDHKITAIKVLSNSDDAAFFNRASAGVIKNILAKQSLKVDVVSGATYSSNGIMEAVRNALKKAVAKKDNTNSNTSNSNNNNSNNSNNNNNNTSKDDNTTTPSTPVEEEDKIYEGSAVCEPDEDEEFDAYKLTLEVVISADNKVKNIQNIKWSDRYMSAWYNMAQKTMVPKLISYGFEIPEKYDTVSGATCSSNALVKAYKDAISKINK
jgi:uncharacterized protein with FMN-binding domain